MMPTTQEDFNTAEEIDFEPKYMEDGDHGNDNIVQQQLFMSEDEANNEIGKPCARVGEMDQENIIHFGFQSTDRPGLMDFQPQLNDQVQSNMTERPI